MKTRIKGLLAILLGLFMFSSIASKAAVCPQIQNRTHCVIKLTITQYKKDPQTGLCNLPCGTPVSITIPAGGTVPISCVCPCISITIDAINGVPISPVTIDNQSTAPQPLPPNSCGANMVMYDPSIPAFVIMP